MKITAAVLRDAEGEYALETLDLAELAPDQVLVEVTAAGMCHTDVIPRQMPFLLPVVTGHEGAGVVEAVGSDVEGIAVGDHVVLSFDSCGTCVMCSRNRPAYCETFIPRNLTGRTPEWTTVAADDEGGEVAARWFAQSSFATYAITTARNTVVVDGDVPLDIAGPLGCGLLTGAGAVMCALDVGEGHSIAVYGAGAVGLAGVMAAVVQGASTIIAVDLHDHRLELARELGATHTIDGAASDVIAQVQGIAGGGVDHALDTTGNATVMSNAIAALRLGGAAAFVGVQTEPLTLDPTALIGKQITGVLEGSAVPQELIPRLIELWRDGRFPFDRLIEHFALDQINEAEKASLEGRVVKPVLVMPEV